MKKIFAICALMAVSGFAFAGEYASATTTSSTATAGSVSTSQASNSGQGNGNTVTAPITVGCLVNCASTDQGAKDAADAAVQAALINAQAARDVAGTNADAAKAVASTTAVIKNTPSVMGPNLTSSNDTCMGSTSGSANVPGVGIGFGTTWTDENCKMLKNSRELWNMGMKAAAMALMCNDPMNKEALELTGYTCPQTAKAQKTAAMAASAEQPQYTDPIIRARLGLPPLPESK